MKIKLHTLIRDMSSARYHSVPGTISSSQLKDAKDLQVFHRKWILKETPKQESDAFDLGTYVHSGILERHNLSKDCAVYPGKVRRGKEWEDFKKKHSGKAIVTQSAMEHAERLIRCVQASPIATEKISSGIAEVSMFAKIIVYGDEIYAAKHKFVLTPAGWEKANIHEDFWEEIKAEGTSLIIKVRADSLGDGWVLDVKTTGGNARDRDSMKEKIKYYKYDLSAALYLDIFTAGTGKLYKAFIWTFVSKEMYNCRSYCATDSYIAVGRRKWSEAVFNIVKGMKNNWEDLDFMDQMSPDYNEMQDLITT